MREAGAGAPTWDAWVANAGDSRGLLFRPGAGGAETLVASEDHKPDRPDELARIARAAAQRSDRRGASVAGAKGKGIRQSRYLSVADKLFRLLDVNGDSMLSVNEVDQDNMKRSHGRYSRQNYVSMHLQRAFLPRGTDQVEWPI